MVKYIDFIIKNMEPLKVTQLGDSKDGQYSALNYIPGSAVRGYVVNELSGGDAFPNYRPLLLSDRVRFMNAYPVIDGHETIPSPKGFYEYKSEDGSLKNIFYEDPAPGMKRAKLGSFAYVNGRNIHYGRPEVGENLRININCSDKGQDLFRCRYLEAGQYFKGRIALEAESAFLEKEIVLALSNKKIRIGGSRSAGYGLCSVEVLDAAAAADETLFPAVVQPEPGEGDEGEGLLYMMLVSDTAMLNENGSNCGINMDELAELLQVACVEIEKCSTSVVRVHGTNRTWQCRTQEQTMYSAGSGFLLRCTDAEGNLVTPPQGRLREIEIQGIGIRREEGYGQVKFFLNLKAISGKKSITANASEGAAYPAKYRQSSTGAKGGTTNSSAPTAEDKAVLTIAAAGRYRRELEACCNSFINSHEKPDFGRLSASQIGNIEAICISKRYAPLTETKKAFEEFFVQMSRNAKKEELFGTARKTIMRIIDEDIDQLLKTCYKDCSSIYGIGKDEVRKIVDIGAVKMDLIRDCIRYERRG